MDVYTKPRWQEQVARTSKVVGQDKRALASCQWGGAAAWTRPGAGVIWSKPVTPFIQKGSMGFCHISDRRFSVAV